MASAVRSAQRCRCREGQRDRRRFKEPIIAVGFNASRSSALTELAGDLAPTPSASVAVSGSFSVSRARSGWPPRCSVRPAILVALTTGASLTGRDVDRLVAGVLFSAPSLTVTGRWGQSRRVVAGLGVGDEPALSGSWRRGAAVRVSTPVAALKEPLMPFWLVKLRRIAR